jgi:hypothetical protein
MRKRWIFQKLNMFKQGIPGKIMARCLHLWSANTTRSQDLHACKRTFVESGLFNRKRSIRFACIYRWMLYMTRCRHSHVLSLERLQHKSRLAQQRVLTTWATTSILKQLDPDEPMTVSDLSARSSMLLNESPSRIRQCLWEPSISKDDDDLDMDCPRNQLFQALLTSYQRLESERLRRRVVLGWAKVIPSSSSLVYPSHRL